MGRVKYQVRVDNLVTDMAEGIRIRNDYTGGYRYLDKIPVNELLREYFKACRNENTRYTYILIPQTISPPGVDYQHIIHLSEGVYEDVKTASKKLGISHGDVVKYIISNVYHHDGLPTWVPMLWRK